MGQEEKELLLKYLCAALPYGVKFLRESWNYEWDQEMSVVETLEDIDNEGYINHTKVYNVEDIKPYLRPMSSMTEDEQKEYYSLCEPEEGFDSDNSPIILAYYNTIPSFDWLLANHFDFMGLISIDCAIDCTNLDIYKD